MSLIKEELQTSKKNLAQSRMVTNDIDLDDLKNGEILVQIQTHLLEPQLVFL